MKWIEPMLAYTDADGWHAGIGDPTLMGWVTVVAYGAAAILCAREAVRSRARESARQQYVFWLMLALILGALGVNKQLDLQTWFTLAGKKVAQAQGWYEQRRYVQAAFIGMIAIGAMLGFGRMWRLIQGQARGNWLALAGLFFLLAFVVIRAASFHHVDWLLKMDFGGLRLNWVLELTGIGMIMGGVLRAKRKGQNPALASVGDSGRLRPVPGTR